jgi:hypothetical protein
MRGFAVPNRRFIAHAEKILMGRSVQSVKLTGAWRNGRSA